MTPFDEYHRTMDRIKQERDAAQDQYAAAYGLAEQGIVPREIWERYLVGAWLHAGVPESKINRWRIKTWGHDIQPEDFITSVTE